VLDLARSPLTSRLRDRLLREARPAGGWSYYPGKSSRIEPTVWALLALAETSDADAVFQRIAAPHVQFLVERQGPDGLLRDGPEQLTNFTNDGLTACVLTHFGGPDAPLQRLCEGIARAKGEAVRQDRSPQDNSLQAWPWIPGTFSWVEPTSWCLLALKKNRSRVRAEARILEAEKLLVNRSCTSGGWNYGNSVVFGQDLRAYVPTTAVGLLALQDHPMAPAVVAALTFLEGARLREPSGMALSMAAIALRLFGRAVENVDERLSAVVERAEQTGNIQTLAMVLYALSAEQHGVRAFRV
jgi:hypothetical protein